MTDYLIESSLRTSIGVQSEAQLPSAGLQHLVRLMLEHADRLLTLQQSALAPDRSASLSLQLAGGSYLRPGPSAQAVDFPEMPKEEGVKAGDGRGTGDR